MDPISLEVMWRRWVAIADEIDTPTIRTSFSTIDGASHDVGCVLMDADGDGPLGTVAHVSDVAGHLGDLEVIGALPDGITEYRAHVRAAGASGGT